MVSPTVSFNDVCFGFAVIFNLTTEVWKQRKGALRGQQLEEEKKKDGLLSALIKKLNQSDIIVQPQEGNIMIFPHYIHCL